jgi:wyosine [tRNA(Phe)-imidazoG37] synthetase (radical SAM superfamily)
MNDAHELYITASGDGFGSEFWRVLLKSITMEKYPNTKNLHLHTNGNGWTEKMWNSLQNLHSIPRITAEISIDASTKETYEQIRVGGNWDILYKNLQFIFTKIPNLDFVRLTFVVQNNNYMEMVEFVQMADYLQKLNNMKTEVNFIHINNWGTFTESQFKIKNVIDSGHPEYNMFMNESIKLKELKNDYLNLQIFTNF